MNARTIVLVLCFGFALIASTMFTIGDRWDWTSVLIVTGPLIVGLGQLLSGRRSDERPEER